jgi:hypothetical protein
MRIIVCGGSHSEYSSAVAFELNQLHKRRPVRVLIHGGSQGVCVAAEEWARLNGVSIVRYPPNWVLFGKKAEAVRNAFMLEDSRPDLVMTFPGGRCTADLMRRALGLGLAVYNVPLGDAPRESADTSISKMSALEAA